jgi:uncharacterized protein DUF2252
MRNSAGGRWRSRTRAPASRHRISGYLGKSDAFHTAIAAFANAYDQSERDHAIFKKAVRSGQVAVDMEGDRG